MILCMFYIVLTGTGGRDSPGAAARHASEREGGWGRQGHFRWWWCAVHRLVKPFILLLYIWERWTDSVEQNYVSVVLSVWLSCWISEIHMGQTPKISNYVFPHFFPLIRVIIKYVHAHKLVHMYPPHTRTCKQVSVDWLFTELAMITDFCCCSFIDVTLILFNICS